MGQGLSTAGEMMDDIITLDGLESEWADKIANARFNESRSRNRIDATGFGPSLPANIIGAGGEIAFCKAFNIEFVPTINTFKSFPDVPPDFEIRTAFKDDGDMAFRKGDFKHLERRHIFLALRRFPSAFRFVGWVRGDWVNEWVKAGMIQIEARYAGTPCHFVPQDFFWPIGSLDVSTAKHGYRCSMDDPKCR